MTDKLKSRKFWLTFLVVVLLAFGQMLGLDIDVDKAWQLVGVASSYVFGQSLVDRSLAAKVDPPAPTLSVSGHIPPGTLDELVARRDGEVLT
ncbi:MAG: hypothetical protein AAF721_00480 [Myxococcota bacterium]